MKMTKTCLWAEFLSKIQQDYNQHHLDAVSRCEVVTGLLKDLDQNLYQIVFDIQTVMSTRF